MTPYYFLKQLQLLTLTLYPLIAVYAQKNTDDWQMKVVKARNHAKHEGIPSFALSTSISIKKFKRKLQPIKQEIALLNPDEHFEIFIIRPIKEAAHLFTIQIFKGY